MYLRACVNKMKVTF